MRTVRGSEGHLRSMRVHALRRLFQRHGLALTNAEYDALVIEIASGRNRSVGPARYGGTLHVVRIRGRDVYAVWAEGGIATFLPGGVPFEVRYPAITKAISV